MSQIRYQSLRLRLLVPLLAACVVAAVVVAIVSYRIGAHWARQEVERRFEGMRSSLSSTAFPLTATVIRSLANLTQTEITTFDARGAVLSSTLGGSTNRLERLAGSGTSIHGATFETGGQLYVAFAFPRDNAGQSVDRVRQVLILFDDGQIKASQARAAGLPLITGLSTIVLLGSLTLALTGRLVQRLSQLEKKVNAVAGGAFETTTADAGRDEVGSLGRAVDRMAEQLQQLWKAVNLQQGEKLLHQIAGGMAHQVRNSLTGARLAIELHAKHCDASDKEDLDIAVTQMEQLDDYVRRLMLVGAGRTSDALPQPVAQCLRDAQSSLTSMAKHLGVQVEWDWPSNATSQLVQDGPALTAAITNLVLNAIQMARTVEVDVEAVGEHLLEIRVTDDGPGIPPSLAEQIFEPFVSTKPEGLGLGLPLVRRSAEALGGSIEWRRDYHRTVFILRVRTQ